MRKVKSATTPQSFSSLIPGAALRLVFASLLTDLLTNELVPRRTGRHKLPIGANESCLSRAELARIDTGRGKLIIHRS
jgi:hypothetical protein